MALIERTNDSGHKLRAPTFQLQETLGHLQSLNALISTALAAHDSFMPVLGGYSFHGRRPTTSITGEEKKTVAGS